MNATIIGVSADSLESHRKFADNHGLTFPLLSDSDGELAGKYGVKMRGSIIERVTFVIGPDKKIVKVLSNMAPTKHVDEAKTACGGLGDKSG
jgi:peroxiredoxin Q/BCP